jgi:hypothetical protein
MFELVEQLYILLGDFVMLLVVPVREGPALASPNFLVALYSLRVEGQLIFTFLTNLF